jgi:uncharacterized membrane protein (DUF106 family)
MYLKMMVSKHTIYTIASAFGEVENLLFLEEKRMQISLATQYVLLYYFVIKIVSSIIIRKKLNIILEVPIFVNYQKVCLFACPYLN